MIKKLMIKKLIHIGSIKGSVNVVKISEQYICVGGGADLLDYVDSLFLIRVILPFVFIFVILLNY